MHLLYDEGDVYDIVLRRFPDKCHEYIRLERAWRAHLGACPIAGIIDPLLIHSSVPPFVTRELPRALSMALKVLWDDRSQNDQEGLERYVAEVLPRAKVMYEIEKNGIHVDVPRAQELSRKEDSHVLRQMAGAEGGFLWTKFDVRLGRTGRIGIEGGFRSDSIPHGSERRCITSRWEGGRIAVLDFNAIDYRCLVEACGDSELQSFYHRCRDFHQKNADFLEVPRTAAKKIAYVSIYGGTNETVSKGTGIPPSEVEGILARLNERIHPIHRLRRRLYMDAQSSEFVVLPNGRRVHVSKSDHEGKVVGLFAQSYSSMVFDRALQYASGWLAGTVGNPRVPYKSKIILTVHDEAVVDVHPDEIGVERELADVMQINDHGHEDHVVRAKIGENYDEAE